MSTTKFGSLDLHSKSGGASRRTPTASLGFWQIAYLHGWEAGRRHLSFRNVSGNSTGSVCHVTARSCICFQGIGSKLERSGPV